MKLKRRCYWTLANYHGDLWHFYQTEGGFRFKLWEKKSDLPGPLRKDVRAVRVEITEKPLRRRKKSTRQHGSIDALITEYVGGRYRFREAKKAVLKRITKSL